jgi:PAP2 superfamily C-terminal
MISIVAARTLLERKRQEFNVHAVRNRERIISATQLDERTAKIIWRDLLFLVMVGFALAIIGYVEKNATIQSELIFDKGFQWTAPLHALLEQHRDWNDRLAAMNSISLLLPVLYTSYVTVWVGDYSLPFRVIAIQLLRSLCGWFTYLPPDPKYLTSFYDFPDILHCAFENCSGAPKVLPFVSFFSGHVATMVIAASHMWLHNHKTISIVLHLLNVFQMIRLLATRGHYSIDIIIAWYMAVYVSNAAGRLGRHYSQGATMKQIMPGTATEAFETVTGVSDARNEATMASLLMRHEFQDLLMKLQQECECEETRTTARIIHERVSSLSSDDSRSGTGSNRKDN